MSSAEGRSVLLHCDLRKHVPNNLCFKSTRPESCVHGPVAAQLRSQAADRGTPQLAGVREECTREREGMYHRGVEEGGGVAAEETQRGETEGSFVRQEAAETRALSLGTVGEQRETWERCDGGRKTKGSEETPGRW